MVDKQKLDRDKLKREKPVSYGAVEEKDKEVPVTAGRIDKALDLAFNPSREKIREVTIVDRIQGKLFPLLDVVNAGFCYILEIAQYRQDAGIYQKIYEKVKPKWPNLLDEYMYRTAQWQKSVSGTNLVKITDIALAEVETRIEAQEDIFGRKDEWGEK